MFVNNLAIKVCVQNKEVIKKVFTKNQPCESF